MRIRARSPAGSEEAMRTSRSQANHARITLTPLPALCFSPFLPAALKQKIADVLAEKRAIFDGMSLLDAAKSEGYAMYVFSSMQQVEVSDMTKPIPTPSGGSSEAGGFLTLRGSQRKVRVCVCVYVNA